jgi:hypothetical protein
MFTSVIPPRQFPMSPQLQQILVHAKQLTHAEQLQLITHLVNHTLPLAPEPLPLNDGRSPGGEPQPKANAGRRSAKPTNIPAPNDPQCAEFRAEIAQYNEDLQQQ